jgi:hypothetical protein
VALAAAGAIAIAASRASHLQLVWIEEAYGMAAAAEILRGKRLYVDIWFDKPPLYAWFYTLCGALPGWPLRLLGTVFLLFCGWSVYKAGSVLWDRQAGLMSAGLLWLALTFWFPASVMAIAPDVLMIAPHALSVAAIASGWPVAAGALAGIALLVNSKALLLLLPLLVVWERRSASRTLAGFGAVTAAGHLFLPLEAYWQQVWWWGSRYSSDTFVQQPAMEFLRRSAGWLAFHATAVLGTIAYMRKTRDWRIGVWVGVALVGVAAGLRFFPRYYFLLLPPVALAGGRGLLLLPARVRMAALLLLLIPAVRFGPRYVDIAMHGAEGWADAALMHDSRAAAKLAGSGSLLVWGYRPDVHVFSGAPAATQFLDSQPLTGVLADRHLVSSIATFPELAAANRRALAEGPSPDVIVDGLGALNPELAIGRYPELAPLLRNYREAGRTRFSVILRRGQ